jgi:hypothetical protein
MGSSSATQGPRLQVAQAMGGLQPEEARLLGNVAKVRLAAITAGAGTASVLLSTGTGSSAPASPGPSEGRFNLHFFGQRPAFFGQPFG